MFALPDHLEVQQNVTGMVERRDVKALTSLVCGLMEERFSLAARVQALLTDRFGRSSEKLRGQQFELIKLAEQSAAAPAQTLPEPPAPPPVKPSAPARKRGGRHPLPVDLPRRRVVVEPSEAQMIAAFGTGPRTRIGEDLREVLDYIPARLEVIVYVYPKYTGPNADPGLVVASRVGLPIEGGIPSPALLAHVIVEKFRWHMPLHRLVKKLLCMGVVIPVATLCNWIKHSDKLLKAFSDLALQRVIAGHLVGADDTPVDVLDPDHPNHIRIGRMWLLVGDDAVAFKYTPDWTGPQVQAILEKHEGPIQGDGYKGLDAMFAKPGAKQIRAGCMMHCRRGFKKSLDGNDKRAAYPLAIIKRLYAVEECADLWGMKGDARRDFRRQHSKPLCDALRHWCANEGAQATPKSPLGKAVTYANNQWKSLMAFLDDGAIPLDNGRVERGHRGIAVGRNNWLFFGADAGGERAATILTGLGNCLLHGADPEEWLTDVFTKLANGWIGKPADLMPDAWAKQKAQQLDAKTALAAA